jgi:predicted transcriptional regulator with HTH domain
MADNINVSSQASALRKLKESMYATPNSFMGEADKEEEISVKDISFKEGELFAFNNISDCAYAVEEIFEQSKLEAFVLTFLRDIFADAIKVSLIYRTVAGVSKWQLKCDFNFMTDKEFEAVSEDSTESIVRAVSSTFDPSKMQGGLMQSILSLNENQQLSSADITKYAKITTTAKQMLTTLLSFNVNNKKRRWIRGEHYDISYFSQTSFNGAKYNNIIASIYLDAETALTTFCAVKEDKAKYKFALKQIANKLNGQNSIFSLKRISKKARKTLSNEYGIQFQD